MKISPIFNIDLEKGMRHQDIRRLQQLLNTDPDTQLANTGPGSSGNETDFYGPTTVDAVIRFQLKNGVISKKNESGAGRTGPKTREALKEVFKTSVVPIIQPPVSHHILNSPPLQSKCFEVYGDFRTSNWKKENLVKCDLDFMRSQLEHVVIGWEQTSKAFMHNGWTGFYCHKLIAPHFQRAFKNMSEGRVFNHLKTYDGCLADPPRQMRGGNNWSMHSWGIAVDLNAKMNPMGNEKFDMTEEFAKCFEDAGFVWGGRWKGRYADAMHFQYAVVN